jgi:hypothetical protein
MSALLNVSPRMAEVVSTIGSCSVMVILFATAPSDSDTSTLLPLRRHLLGADGALLREVLVSASR